MQIYCSKTVVNFDKITIFNPKIIGANHPNSFFDAISLLLVTPNLFFFLARGDAFNKPLVAKFHCFTDDTNCTKTCSLTLSCHCRR
jgi:hypothetical protein